MEKREKIILVLVLIAAVYGVIDFSMTRQKKKVENLQAQADSQGIAELSSQVSTLSTADDRKIDRLAAALNEPWPETTFALRKADFGDKSGAEEPKDTARNDLQTKADQLNYSGFLAMGADLIAIINGMDYRIGEQVNGFTVTKISQEAIQVSQQDAFFTVPAISEK